MNQELLSAFLNGEERLRKEELQEEEVKSNSFFFINDLRKDCLRMSFFKSSSMSFLRNAPLLSSLKSLIRIITCSLVSMSNGI